jgi:hypothetical protein
MNIQKYIPRFCLLLMLMGGFQVSAQKEPVRYGFSAGTSFYQPRIRLHQNAPIPGMEFGGMLRTGDGGTGTFLFEFGYLMTRIIEARSFYSYTSGMNIRDANCMNLHHYLTFSGSWRHEIFEDEVLSLQAGLRLNWLVRNNSFCRYQVDSTRQVEWQGPFDLSGRDRFYPVFITGADSRLISTRSVFIYLYINAFHQLFAFSPGGGYKDPLLSSRYFAPFMGWNVGIRFLVK